MDNGISVINFVQCPLHDVIEGGKLLVAESWELRIGKSIIDAKSKVQRTLSAKLN